MPKSAAEKQQQKGNENQPAKRRGKEPKNPRDFVCDFPECGKDFTRAYSLERHMKTHAGTLFKCSSCDHTFSTEDGLESHQGAARNTICVFNPSDYVDISDNAVEANATASNASASNWAKPNDKGRYECTRDGCKKDFADKSSLNQHVKTHDGIRFDCACGATFSRCESLQYHTTHTKTPEKCIKEKKEYRCGCGGSFGRWQNFRDHAGRFTAPKVCQDSFASAIALATSTVVVNPPWPPLSSDMLSLDNSPALSNLTLPSSDSDSSFGPEPTVPAMASDPLFIKPRPRVKAERFEGVHSWTRSNLDDGTSLSYTERDYLGVSLPLLPEVSLYETMSDPLEDVEYLETIILPDGRPSYGYVPEADLGTLCGQLEACQVSSRSAMSSSPFPLGEDLSGLLDSIFDGELDPIEEEGLAQVVEGDYSDKDYYDKMEEN